MSANTSRRGNAPPPRKKPPTTPIEKRVLTVPEAAAALDIHESTAWRLVYRGVLGSIKIGRLRKVPRQCVDEYIDNQLALAASA